MEKLDQDLQKRVWQRVQGKNSMPPLGKVNCKSWMLAAQENAAVYHRFAQSAQGREAEQLKRMYQECQKCIACLKGICRLRGERVEVRPLPREKEPRRNQLELCYSRERKLWEELDQYTCDSDHGLVYGRLARQAQEHCVTILEILGRI